MKFLIVEPSPLPNVIALGPKYSPQDPVQNRFYTDNIVSICHHVKELQECLFEADCYCKCYFESWQQAVRSVA